MRSQEKDFLLQFGLLKPDCPNFFNFCKEVYKNRFFCNQNHPVFKAILNHQSELTKTFYQGRGAFRARIVPKSFKCRKKQEGFQVSNEKEIGAPPVCNEGRANPPYVSRLYVADSQYCALSEVRPACGNDVLIGTGHAIQDLKYISLVSYPCVTVNQDKSIIDILDKVFARPIIDDKAYLPTQVISEFVYHVLGLDGIAYSSSQCPGGINYCFFNPALIRFTTDQLFSVRQVSYCAESFSPQLTFLKPNQQS